MNEITFDKLEGAIPTPSHRPLPGARLVIASRPVPFVAPTLHNSDLPQAEPFTAEVVFVEASAAVGKSTMAQYLSDCQLVPLLDLSKVPVSTGSLKSLVSDLSGEGDPVKAFHGGTLPIIIDALDEGRLLSGETGFESFLQTTGEFLLQDRSVTTSPKLIFFGRHESVEDARTWLELAAADVTTRSAEVGFFGEQEARELIDAYALSLASSDAAYRSHPQPAGLLIDAYFCAIEAALGLSRGELWTDERGRAFAGYAPVLAALGSLLADMDNFQEVANLLNSEGRQEAWAVIETVLDEILKREKIKVCDKLAKQVGVPMPDEAYDAHEQLTFIARRVHSQPRGTSTRVKLPAAEQAKYYSMVDQYLGDHPFVRQNKLSNAVLGSLVIAHAVQHDLLKNMDLHVLADLSRQPFLWRSLHRQMGGSGKLEIDGRYMGYVLNSFWNDPITNNPRVIIRSAEEGWVSVDLPMEAGKELSLRAFLPLHLYGQVRDGDVDVAGRIKLEGHAATGMGSTFYVHGNTVIICESTEVAADAMTIDGRFWLESSTLESLPRLRLSLKKGARVGWGGTVVDSYPWSEFPSTLEPPHGPVAGDVLTTLLTECSLRLPSGVLVVSDEYSFSESENQWVARRFAKEFPQLLKLLVRHNLATVESFGTYAQTKYRIHMKTTWADLHKALGDSAVDPALKAFLDEAKLMLD